MVNETDKMAYQQWFDTYAASFNSNDPEMQGAVAVKCEHTANVCSVIEQLAERLELPPDEQRTAWLCALLHDVGRFEQYRRYRTFNDGQSEDHARIGVRVIEETGVLDQMDRDTRARVVRAVACHNRLSVPMDDPPETLRLIRLVRDADKIDIWRVMVQRYSEPATARNRSITLGLPDLPGVTPEVLNAVMEERMAEKSEMRILNDFKLLQMGWVFDLNFAMSFEMVRERQFLEKIRQSIPEDNGGASKAYEKTARFVSEQIAKREH